MPGEECDNGGLPGCTSECTVEEGWDCRGGSPISPDECHEYPDAHFLRNTQTESDCGNGEYNPNEMCDDNNTLSGDGWSSTCQVEDRYACRMNAYLFSTCEKCLDNYGIVNEESDTWPEGSWVSTWNNFNKEPYEEWEDIDTDDSNGWTNECSIRPGWICRIHTILFTNICYLCDEGSYPDERKLYCISKWGDGLTYSPEECDDKNDLPFDGCNSDCQIEYNSICNRNPGDDRDDWEVCAVGFYANDDKDTWNTEWGDKIIAGDEVCDDGDMEDNDGCDANWIVEDGWDWSTNPDISGSFWAPVWGDGMKIEEEECDDKNTNPDDGWNAECAITDGWVCSYNSSLGYDVCEQCLPGKAPNEDKDECLTVCGDGQRLFEETWDDNNTLPGDGCASNCTIEHGWYCELSNPDICTTEWGDKIIAGDETCDDGDADAGDGCDSDWIVEDGWDWSTNPYISGSFWAPVWGDGMMIDDEECDDKNTNPDDGWNAECAI